MKLRKPQSFNEKPPLWALAVYGAAVWIALNVAKVVLSSP
jgi:hypothetical protein